MQPQGDGRIIAISKGQTGHPDCELRIYHRDFPEICVEGRSLIEGATLLINSLSRHLEGVSDAWHREIILDAIADARALSHCTCSYAPFAPRPRDLLSRGGQLDGICSEDGPLPPVSGRLELHELD